MSSSLPAPIQEFGNLIQGILRGLGGKEFTPTHPGLSLTPHFFCYLSLQPGKASADFLPRGSSHPNPVLLCPSATCDAGAATALTPEHPCTAPHVGTGILPLAGISSWIYKHHRHRDPLQRAFLLSEITKNFQELSSISFLHTMFTEMKSPGLEWLFLDRELEITGTLL